MTPITTLTTLVAPLPRDNVDTDTVIPSREMRSTGKTGLADGLFAPWRYADVDARVPNPDFVLNDPIYADAQILGAGKNFGCGSSREHAVWALAEYGIRCMIAESFAPIFYQNCVRNGLLAVVLDKDALTQISGTEVTIDLPAQTVTSSGQTYAFDIGEEAKTMLVEGLDGIDLTLKHADTIAAWQAADGNARPYIYLGDNS
jgi:3-isopropylmalate/(R)-2-methylmalate dehydratase small subunit